MKLLVKLAFFGGNYHGWQIQENALSVQSVVCDAARAVFGVYTAVTGCSRTDSGVHAREFFCTLEPAPGYNGIPREKLTDALNSVLPDDISVYSAKEVDESFHARYSAKSKEYEYIICNSRIPDPFLVGRSCLCRTPLDIGLIKAALPHFMGEHDFSAFMASNSKITDTVREIYTINCEKSESVVKIRVSANGFLYNMVRIIAGTLISVGEGKIPPDAIPEIIASRDRSRSGATMPPCGLYLNKVEY